MPPPSSAPATGSAEAGVETVAVAAVATSAAATRVFFNMLNLLSNRLRKSGEVGRRCEPAVISALVTINAQPARTVVRRHKLLQVSAKGCDKQSLTIDCCVRRAACARDDEASRTMR